jgi:hypothetical protein
MTSFNDAYNDIEQRGRPAGKPMSAMDSLGFDPVRGTTLPKFDAGGLKPVGGFTGGTVPALGAVMLPGQVNSGGMVGGGDPLSLPSSFPRDLPSFRRPPTYSDVGEGTTFADLGGMGGTPRPNRQYVQPNTMSPGMRTFQAAGSPFPRPYPSTRMAEGGQPLTTRSVQSVQVNPDGSIPPALNNDMLAEYAKTYTMTTPQKRTPATSYLPPEIGAMTPDWMDTRRIPGQSIIERSNVSIPRLQPGLQPTEYQPRSAAGVALNRGIGLGTLTGQPTQVANAGNSDTWRRLFSGGTGGPGDALPPLTGGNPQDTRVISSPTLEEQRQASGLLQAAGRGAAGIPAVPGQRQLIGRVGEYQPRGNGGGAQDGGGLLSMLQSAFTPRNGLPQVPGKRAPMDVSMLSGGAADADATISQRQWNSWSPAIQARMRQQLPDWKLPKVAQAPQTAFSVDGGPVPVFNLRRAFGAA